MQRPTFIHCIMKPYIVAIDEPGGNRNRSINIKAQHKTRRAAITQIYF